MDLSRPVPARVTIMNPHEEWPTASLLPCSSFFFLKKRLKKILKVTPSFSVYTASQRGAGVCLMILEVAWGRLGTSSLGLSGNSSRQDSVPFGFRNRASKTEINIHLLPELVSSYPALYMGPWS